MNTVRSLVGQKFGLLTVTHFAGTGPKDRHSYWCCQCECGATLRVHGGALLGTRDAKHKGHPQKSCGCLRADPEVRRLARAKVAPERRREICEKMRAAVTNRKPAYSLSADRAAELLGVSSERIQALAADGMIGATVRRGYLFVSSREIASMIASMERSKRRCQHFAH